MSARRFLFCATILLLCANAASAARYQRCKDGKTLVWNSLRGVAQEATWSGLRDVNGYATGPGTLIWFRLADVVNSYTGKMVKGKFEGVVIKEQAGTRLQAKFANGEKVSGWSEPGESENPPSTAAPTPKAKSTSTVEPEAEESPEESASPIPTPRPTPTITPRPSPTPTLTPIATPTPTPMPTLKPTATPIRTPSPAATLTPVPTPTPTPRPTPTPASTSSPVPELTPPRLKSIPSSNSPAPSEKPFGLERGITAPTRDSLDLAMPQPQPSSRSALPSPPWSEPSLAPTPVPQKSAPEDRHLASPTPGAATAMLPLTGSKAQMIAEFKKETSSVLAQVKNATQNFREVQSIDAVQTLPPEVSASVSALGDQARDFRAKLGYEVTFYECGAETAIGEALMAVDQSTHELTEKNAPAGRSRVLNFFKRYPAPSRDNQKPLWRYLASIMTSCDRAKKEAEDHLDRAKAFESAGKKAEALAEYREIYRVYPNAITADKIRELQGQPR